MFDAKDESKKVELKENADVIEIKSDSKMSSFEMIFFDMSKTNILDVVNDEFVVVVFVTSTNDDVDDEFVVNSFVVRLKFL